MDKPSKEERVHALIGFLCFEYFLLSQEKNRVRLRAKGFREELILPTTTSVEVHYANVAIFKKVMKSRR